MFSAWSDVFTFFNHNAFVYFDPSHPQKATEQVRKLHNSETEYFKMLSQPVLAPGASKNLFSLFHDRKGRFAMEIRRFLEL